MNMSQNYQEKYLDLEKNHKKLLGITMALIEALESAVSNKQLNLEATLARCMSIYPELFNVGQEKLQEKNSTATNNNLTIDSEVELNKNFSLGMQKPTILIESEEFVSSSSHDKLNRIPSPMTFHISFPTQKNTNESYSDSEAYTALKTVNNTSFLRANSISVTDKNEIMDLPNYTNFPLENGNVISQNLPMVLTAKAFDVCSQLKINFNDDNTISNSIVIHQQNDDENSNMKPFTHERFIKCEDYYKNGEENFQLPTKTVSQLNNLSNGVKSRQKQINESSAEDTDELLNIDYETFSMDKSDKINNQTSEKSYFHKIKHGIIFNSIDKQVKILETLRKKLIHSLAQDRANTLDIYINHDIFDIYSHQILFKKLLPLGLVNGWDLKLQQVILKFINSVSSIQKGRDYLTSNTTLAKYLSNLYTDKNHQKGMCIIKNKEMIMAIFHKLSVKQNQQLLLKTIIQNVVNDLLENQNLTFYQIRHTLGYLINMCLEPENMCTIEKFASDLLQMLGNLLLTKDLKISTEVDRLLYILMSNSKFQQEAKSLKLPAMIKQISEKCNKRLKSQLERVISVMIMPVPHNNLQAVKDEYLNYIEIELNELEEEVEIGETTSVIDIKEIIKEEKNQLFNNKPDNSIKTEKAIPKESAENVNSASFTCEEDDVFPISKAEDNEDTIYNQSKRFIRHKEIKESETKFNNKKGQINTGFKKRINDDRNNNTLSAKNIVIKPESSFIVLDDSPVKIKKSKIKKANVEQTQIETSKNKIQMHKKDQDMKFESYDYCEETKQIQVPLQHGNIFNEYRHSPYKEFIMENVESISKTRPNSRAD